MTDTPRRDAEYLIGRPEFRRFLLRAIQSAGIFYASANGSDGRNLWNEGRRSLGFDILAEAALGQSAPDEAGLITLFQILREELQQPSEDQKRGRRNRYDRTDELRDDSKDGSGDASR